MNRRRFARVRASLRITFTWEEHFALFRTVDVSASGVLLTRHDADASQPLPELGMHGQCAFTIDNIEVRTDAKVVRQVADGFALRFEGLPRALEDRLVAWVFRREALSLSRRMPA